MYKVTDNQVDFILDDIEKRGITTEDVRYNILDHVCCIIENEMSNEMNFAEFYRKTIARFYKKELGEIEEETRVLLTFKNYHAMKRTLKISGITSSILILIGVTCKFMHWPGAGVAILLGLVMFSLLFIPLNIILKFKDDTKGSNRLIMTIGLLTVSAATIGTLFKIMHWPFANILMTASLIIFILVFIPMYFIIKFKDPETKFNAIIHTTFMIAGAGMLFALLNITNSSNHNDAHENGGQETPTEVSVLLQDNNTEEVI